MIDYIERLISDVRTEATFMKEVRPKFNDKNGSCYLYLPRECEGKRTIVFVLEDWRSPGLLK